MSADGSNAVIKMNAGRLLGILGLVLTLATMTYLVFGPTISFTTSEMVVKDPVGVRTVGKAVSGTTSAYATNDRALLYIAAGTIIAAFLGAFFAWQQMRLAVITVGLLLVVFSFLAILGIGLFIFPLGLVFLAAGILCRPLTPTNREAGRRMTRVF